MKKFDSKSKKQIIEDWASILPQFSQFAPMRLGRIVGPFLQGICLDRDSSGSSYLPTLHIHNLCRPFPVITMNLGQPLTFGSSGIAKKISILSHSDNFRDACKELLLISFLPTHGDIKIREMESCIKKYKETKRPDADFPAILMEDVVTFWAWLGNEAEAVRTSKSYSSVVNKWPDYVFSRDGGKLAWCEKLTSIATSGNFLRDVAEEQIQFHKLAHLPKSRLIES